MLSSFTKINAKLLLSIMNISFTTFSALSYRLTLLDQHNCHHFLVHIYSDRKSLYNVQINYCLAFGSVPNVFRCFQEENVGALMMALSCLCLR